MLNTQPESEVFATPTGQAKAMIMINHLSSLPTAVMN